MEKDKYITRVMFRKYPNGDIIALFPDDVSIGKWGVNLVNSYEHIGQHGEASYEYVLRVTKLANPDEYNDLFVELKSIGYNLKVCKRR